MKRVRWQIIFATSLISAAVIVYILQIFIFHRIEDTGFYLFQDLAFVFISVLLVTLVIDQLLRTRDKREMMSKLNMVIGVFFSEVGTKLLKDFFWFDAHFQDMRKRMLISDKWMDRDFTTARKAIKSYESGMNSRSGDLEHLSNFLFENRNMMLRLLENPNLLEHEGFTDMLRAVFHLAEELASRKNLVNLSGEDHDHISKDIKRAYIMLMLEWLEYNRHLKHEYPYLYSLAVRMNPFDPDAKAEIK